MSPYWLGNYNSTWTLIALNNDNPNGYMAITPRLTNNLRSFEIYNGNATSAGSKGSTGVYQTPIDVTNISQLVFDVSKYTSSPSLTWSALFAVIANSSTATGAISGKLHTVYSMGGSGSTPSGTDGTFSIDVSDLTGTVYINLRYNLGDSYNSQSANKVIGITVNRVYAI